MEDNSKGVTPRILTQMIKLVINIYLFSLTIQYKEIFNAAILALQR